MKKLRYGIIGAGWIADLKHLKAYSQMPKVELTAICNHNIEKAEVLAKKYGIQQVFSSYEEMFKQCDLDIVSICTPNALHLPAIETAIRHGVHIHCEKPLVLNEQEVTHIQLLNKDSKVKIFVGMNYRYSAPIRYLKDLIAKGDMGHIYHVKCVWNRRRGIPGLGGWFTNKKLSGGGPLIDLGVHLIDLSMHLLDFPDPIHISGTTYAHFSNVDESINRGTWASDSIAKTDKVVDVEDMAVGLVKYSNRSTFYVETSWASNVKEEHLNIEVFGTKAGAKTDGNTLQIFGEMIGTLVDISPLLDNKDPHLLEVQDFLDSVQYDTKEESSIEQARKVMRIIDTIYAQE